MPPECQSARLIWRRDRCGRDAVTLASGSGREGSVSAAERPMRLARGLAFTHALQSYVPTVSELSLAPGGGALPSSSKSVGPVLSRQFFWGNVGIIGGFPPSPQTRANPSPRAARCLTNGGWPGGLRLGILAART